MKSCKSYTCKISGNIKKVNFLSETLDIIEDLSWYVFNLNKRFPNTNWWYNQKKLYHQCRKFFPELNSKILQNFISLYKPKTGRKLPKYKPIRSSIYIDQAFNFHITDNSLTNFWLRFSRRNFPLFGKFLKDKILDPSKIKLIQIFKNSKGLYCKLMYVQELPDITTSNNSKIIGLDLNTKRLVLSNNIFYKYNRLYHRKLEHKKNNLKKHNLQNYTKDFVHKLTTQISNDLNNLGVEVLVLEDLRNLRKSASRKLKTSKGKGLNYIINSIPWGMFSNFLTYKCLDRGIKVEKIHPAYTSKTCSRCESKNTTRPRQDKFVCLECKYQLDADLNGSRNIEYFYRKLNGLQVNLTQD